MTTTAERVAAAWAAGFEASASSFHTDGESVYSWGWHEIGRTTDGRKVAYCCHYSNSTAVHSGLLYDWADEIIECKQHGRPDLHKDERLRWQRPVLTDLCRNETEYSRTPTPLLRANAEATCAYLCLFCKSWHANFGWAADARESASEHSADEHKDGLSTHRLNPQAFSQDELYRRYGFAGTDEFYALTSSNRVLSSDNMATNWPKYRTWQLLDKTKVGLLAAFPELLLPQPAERLWHVRAYTGRTWHRAQGPNPPVYDERKQPPPVALCGARVATNWADYRETLPTRGIVCKTCGEAPATC